MLVGAFDPGAWTGLVFCNGPGRGFAFRFAVECDGQRFDGYDFLDIVHKVGPHAPDGSFARMSFDTSRAQRADSDAPPIPVDDRRASMVLEWSNVSEYSCVGRVQMDSPATVEFRAYFPWDWTGFWSHVDGHDCRSFPRYSVHGATDRGKETIDVVLQQFSANAATVVPPSRADTCARPGSKATTLPSCPCTD